MSDNMIFVDFGVFSIYWYGVFMGLGIFPAALAFSLLRRMQGESFSSGVTVALISMPTALVTSRIFYCWFGKASFPNGIMDCLNLMSGGYAMYGALLGIVAVLLIYSAVCKKSAPQLLDAAVPPVAFVIAVGRFASITGDTDVGFSVSSSLLQRLPFAVWSESEQSWLLWTGFFEGTAAVIIFAFTLVVFLMKYRKKSEGMLSGDVTLMFMLTYGLSQAMLESMRDDSLFMVSLGFVRINQIISIVIAVVAIIIIAVRVCLVKRPAVPDVILWIICAAALGLAVYSEFKMNVVSMVRNYVIMGVSLTVMLAIALFLFFTSVKHRRNSKPEQRAGTKSADSRMSGEERA